MNENESQRAERERRAINVLTGKGWTPLGSFRFLKGGKVYDLSAADLSQIARIEADGLFLVSFATV